MSPRPTLPSPRPARPLGKLLLKLVLLDRKVVLPVALGVTMIGVFALRRSLFDVYVLLLFGLLGYFMLRYGYSTAAAAVGMILGPGLEANLRLGLLLMDSSAVKFVTRPWTAIILSLAVILLVYGALGNSKISRQRAASAS